MSDTILVINCGSSSLKYQLINPVSEDVLAAGLAEKIGEPGGRITHRCDGEEHVVDGDLPDHQAAMTAINSAFAEHGPDLERAGVRAVGHRVVHGGDRFSAPTRITDEVMAGIDALAPLAPLHNPPALMGMRAAMTTHPGVAHVAVFDTAFFADLPPAAFTYAIDAEVARRHHIRRYGFHGTSHDYVSEQTAATLGCPREELRQIVLHLGNGASASAIDRGRPIDTSMGLTPLEGLVMGTRCGDVDPGLPGYLATEAGLSHRDYDTLISKRSGLLGLCGANDFREVVQRRAAGDERAALAFDVFARSITKYVGAYLALLGGADAISFTAGIGEHNALLRRAVCAPLAGLGVRLDDERNEASATDARVVSADDSAIAVLVVPTNEELAIARATAATAGV